jgi:hypothetical protein
MAIRKIRLRRGLEINLPTLDIGEPGFTTDTKRFFIGSATGNIEYPSLTAVQALIDNLDLSEIDLEGYATEEFVSQAISGIEIPSIEGLATEEYVDNAILAIPTTDLTGLATEEYVGNAISAIEIPSIEGLATEEYVADAIAGIPAAPSDISDLTDTTNLLSTGISWSISASGSSDYVFSGPGIVSGNTNDPVLYLYRGFTYTFVNTTGSNHPFAIRVSDGGADYTLGVSGSQTGTQTFVVPMNAPSTLYYQCTIHSAMGNVINIV